MFCITQEHIYAWLCKLCCNKIFYYQTLQQTIAIVGTLSRIYCLSLSHQLMKCLSLDGLPKYIINEVGKTLMPLDRFACLQKSAESFKLLLSPKVTLSVWFLK